MWFLPALALDVTSVTHADVRFTVVRVDPTDRIELVGQSSGIRTLEAALAAVPGARVAVNAGMYHEDRTPVGLHVEGHEVHAPLVLGPHEGNFGLLPNGVFSVGPTAVTVADRLLVRPHHATQSGPMLVIDGALHPAFGPQSPSKTVRNGVGVDDAGRTWLVISREPVRFHDLATLFRDRLGCANALYLDGHVSRMIAPGHPGPRDGSFSGILVVAPG